MRLEAIILADSINMSDNKRLNILGGGVDMILASRFPAVHPKLAIAFRIKLERSEINRKHDLKFEIRGPEKTNLIPPFSSDFSVDFDEKHLGGIIPPFYYFNGLIEIAALNFPHPGVYQIRIFVNEQRMGVADLFVAQMSLEQQAEKEAEERQPG